MISQPENGIPKRFSLLPFEDGSLQVNIPAGALGYVWHTEDKWCARSLAGDLLDTGKGRSVLAAVSAVFESSSVSA